MHYILHLRLCGLYARHHGRKEEKPLWVLYQDKTVLDGDARALARGLRIGMGLSEARILLPEATFDQWLEGDYADAQVEWLDVAARYTGVLEPDAQHAAYLDLSEHPDPLLIALRVVDALTEMGYAVQWGMASAKWVASLASWHDAKAEPLYGPTQFLNKLPTDVLPISPSAHERLKMLGYATIEPIAHLDLGELCDQFGQEGHRIHQSARGDGQEAVRSVYPPNSLTAHFYLQSLCEDRELLDRSLQRISERLGKQLQEQDLQGQEIQASVDVEEGVKSLQRRFTKSIDRPRAVLFALRLMTQDIHESFSGMRITLPRLKHTRRVQQTLKGTISDKATSAESAFRHLKLAYGDTVILKASEVKVERRKQLLKAWRDATGWQ